VRAQFSLPRRSPRLNSFTLVELLIVILIILLLAALTLAAGEAAMNAAARSRARGEIQAITSALESYKTDNGTYPWTDASSLAAYNGTTFTKTNDYNAVANDPAAGGGDYMVAAQILYEALSGQTNYEDNISGYTPPKSYMNFKPSELGNIKATGGNYGTGTSTYVQDPFSYPYGYYTYNPAAGTTPNTANYPFNGSGTFDLWSTGSTTASSSTWTTTAINTWISNWAP
jgi:type II secretory pathway pseudopilin PulG